MIDKLYSMLEGDGEREESEQGGGVRNAEAWGDGRWETGVRRGLVEQVKEEACWDLGDNLPYRGRSPDKFAEEQGHQCV